MNHISLLLYYKYTFRQLSTARFFCTLLFATMTKVLSQKRQSFIYNCRMHSDIVV